MAVFPGYALIVGVGTYTHAPLPDVPVTVADARAVAKVLRDPDQCGYPEQHVTLLCDADATHTAILQALDDLAAHATRDDTVFLFYSGGGQYDEHGVYSLTAADTQLADNQKIARGTAIRPDELLERLSTLHALHVLLVFDTSYIAPSPAVLSLDEESSVSDALPSQLASALLATGEGRVVISASRENQHSYPGAGELTYFGQALLDGLRGKGVPSRDRYIDVFDLYTYLSTTVTKAVQQRYRVEQEPELTMLKGFSSFAVALHQGASVIPDSFTAQEQPPTHAAVREVDVADSRALLARRLHSRMKADSGVSFGVLGDDNNEIDIPLDPRLQKTAGVWDDAPMVPKSLPATAGPASVTSLEQRRLEAAMPRSTRVGRPTEIRTMIALSSSEGLRKYLPVLTESGDIIARNDVVGRDVQVAFENEPWITLYLELDAPDFAIEQSVKPLRVPRMSESGVATFFVTPRCARNDGRVVVNLFQDVARQTLVDSLTLMVDIKGRNVAMFFEEIWQVVTNTVSSAGPARQGFALAGTGQQVVYMNVQNQTVVQGDQYTLSGTFQGSNITIKSNLSNASQSIGTVADVHQADKDELQQLLQQLNVTLQGAPAERQGEAEAVATLARQLLDAATTGAPNRTTVQIVTEGLRQASNQIADALPSLEPIVTAMIIPITRLSS